MKEKMTPHIIAVTAFVVFIVLGLACATTPPQGPPPTYNIITKPVAEGFLQGKKAVIFNIKMAERESAGLIERQGSGGIFSLFQGGARLIRLGSFNKRAKAFDKANEADLQEALNVLDEVVATAWQKAYNAETAQAAYNFGKTTPKLNYFSKPNAEIKKEIANVCAQNNAEFAVTIIQQVKHGYMDEGSIAGTGQMRAITQIAAEICVYDKKGAVVIQAFAQLPNVLAGLSYGYNFSPNDGDEYAQLYIEGAVNIIKTILALDPSSAITPDDFKEGIKVQLASTEDEDEEDE